MSVISVITHMMMALALLLIFANGIIYVIAYKRCKVNLTYKEQLNGGFIGKSLTGICLRKTGASLDG